MLVDVRIVVVVDVIYPFYIMNRMIFHMIVYILIVKFTLFYVIMRNNPRNVLIIAWMSLKIHKSEEDYDEFKITLKFSQNEIDHTAVFVSSGLLRALD